MKAPPRTVETRCPLVRAETFRCVRGSEALRWTRLTALLALHIGLAVASPAQAVEPQPAPGALVGNSSPGPGAVSPVSLPAPVNAKAKAKAKSESEESEKGFAARVSANAINKQLRESAYTVTVVDVTRQAGRAANIGEVLNRSAGLHVRESGGVGSISRLMLRGLDSSRVALFIDGVPVLPRDGGPTLIDIPLPLLERAEVYKGIVPAEFGGDGLGSAVNLVTKSQRARYLDVGFSMATYGTYRGLLSGRYVTKDQHFAVDGFVTADLADNDYTMPGLTPDTVLRRDHDRYRQLLAGLGLEVRRGFFDLLRLDVGVGAGSQQLQGLPQFEFLRFNFRAAHFNGQSYFARFSLVKEFAQRARLDYLVDAQQRSLNFVDLGEGLYGFDGRMFPNPNGRGEFGYGPNDTQDRRIDLRQRINVRIRVAPQHVLNLSSFVTGGFRRIEDPVADEAAGFRVTPLPGDVATSSTALAYQADLLKDRLMLVAGLKHLYFYAAGSPTSIYEILTKQELSRVTQSSHSAGGNIGLRYRFHPSLLVKLSYEYGLRLPRTDELFGNGFTVQGSINLVPEKAHNLDLGLALDWRRAAFRVFLSVDAYASFASDLINLTGPATPQYANVTDARILGVEFDLRAELTRWVHLYVNGAYNDARNVTEFVAGTNQPNYLDGLRLPNQPFLYGNYGAELLIPSRVLGGVVQFRVYYDANYVNEFFYDYEVSVNQRRRIPTYLNHNLGAQLNFLGARVSLAVEAGNLGDAQRFDEFARPLPGRTLRLFLRWTTY